jgi:hypothetical protein
LYVNCNMKRLYGTFQVFPLGFGMNHIKQGLRTKPASLRGPHCFVSECRMFWFVSLEKCCYAQLLADAAATGRGGQTVKIEEADALFVAQSFGDVLAFFFCEHDTFE